MVTVMVLGNEIKVSKIEKSSVSLDHHEQVFHMATYLPTFADRGTVFPVLPFTGESVGGGS